MATFNVSEADFEAKVINSGKPVLVDFWAPWCSPCKMAEPVLEELANAYAGRVEIAKLNVDENPNLSMKLGVMSIPTTILFKDAKEVGRQIGFSGKQAFEDLIIKGIGPA